MPIMILTLVLLIVVFLIAYTAHKFYRRMDWDEPAEASPDLQAMHKRQAELLHTQEILEEAAAQGKLSQDAAEEFRRFCASELDAMTTVERAWKERRKK